ncbi:MAG: methionine--tRNA ligase subunit beta [Patescibacteria group bacterium]
MISIEDFKKLEIKIGKIISAEKVEKSTKLLKLIVDFGNETRQILSGIGESFDDPQILVGKQVPVLTNLEPRMIMGLESQGMILATSSDSKVVLLHPSEEILPGSVVR